MGEAVDGEGLWSGVGLCSVEEPRAIVIENEKSASIGCQVESGRHAADERDGRFHSDQTRKRLASVPKAGAPGHDRLFWFVPQERDFVEGRNLFALGEDHDSFALQIHGDSLGVARAVLVGEMDGLDGTNLSVDELSLAEPGLWHEIKPRRGPLSGVVADVSDEKVALFLPSERGEVLPITIGDSLDLDFGQVFALAVDGEKEGAVSAIVDQPSDVLIEATGGDAAGFFQVGMLECSGDLDDPIPALRGKSRQVKEKSQPNPARGFFQKATELPGSKRCSRIPLAENAALASP